MRFYHAAAFAGLLCAMLLASQGCSQAPPAVAELPGLPVRVYAIDKLLTYPLDFGDYNGPRVVTPVGAEPAQPDGLPGKTPSQAQYEGVTQRLKTLIERVVRDGEPWASTGGKAVLEFYQPEGQMYVRQTPEGHREVVKLLEALESERAVTIALEGGLFEVDAAASDALTRFLLAGQPADHGQSQPIIIGNTSSSGYGVEQTDLGLLGLLDREQTAAFLKEAEARSTRIVFLPRITVWNGQRAWVSQGTVHRLALPRVDKPGRPKEMVSFTAGCIFDVKATASADRRYVQLDLRPWYGQLEGGDKVPETGTTSMESKTPLVVRRIVRSRLGGWPEEPLTYLMTSVSVPDGGTLAMRLQFGRSRLVGVTGSSGVPIFGDKAPAGSLDPVWQPVDPKGEPQKYLWLLVKPTIIVEPEKED